MSNELVPAAYVRTHCGGVSDMTIWRWLHGAHDRRTGTVTPPLPDFPKPITINSRRYWRKADVDAFVVKRLNENRGIEGRVL